MNKFAVKAAHALCALGLGLALAGSVQAATSSDEAIIERIKPLGQVCIAGDDSCGGAAAAAPAATAARSGEEVFKASCAACHATGVLNAPKSGTADWEPRVAQGMDTLMTHAINGFNAMPPRGTCATCSDDELQAAIKFMSGM